MNPRAPLQARLRSALSALVTWQERVLARNGQPHRRCRRYRYRPLCPLCRGRIALEKGRAAIGLERALRLLVVTWEKRIGPCRDVECKEKPCLLCTARRALRACSQHRRGYDPIGLRHERRRSRTFGTVCRCGTLLTPETASYQSSGKKQGPTLRCLVCRRQREAQCRRRRLESAS